MDIRVRLELSSTTKNTYKYDAVQGDAAVRTLYVQQEAVTGEDPPQAINVTVTPAGVTPFGGG